MPNERRHTMAEEKKYTIVADEDQLDIIKTALSRYEGDTEIELENIKETIDSLPKEEDNELRDIFRQFFGTGHDEDEEEDDEDDDEDYEDEEEEEKDEKGENEKDDGDDISKDVKRIEKVYGFSLPYDFWEWFSNKHPKLFTDFSLVRAIRPQQSLCNAISEYCTYLRSKVSSPCTQQDNKFRFF